MALLRRVIRMRLVPLVALSYYSGASLAIIEQTNLKTERKRWAMQWHGTNSPKHTIGSRSKGQRSESSKTVRAVEDFLRHSDRCSARFGAETKPKIRWGTLLKGAIAMVATGICGGAMLYGDNAITFMAMVVWFAILIYLAGEAS